MKKGTKLYNSPNCTQYWNYMSTRMAQSTVRGYISALNSPIIKKILNTITTVESIFDIQDSNILVQVIQSVSKNEINKNSHSRYTAALRSYHGFLCQQSI